MFVPAVSRCMGRSLLSTRRAPSATVVSRRVLSTRGAHGKGRRRVAEKVSAAPRNVLRQILSNLVQLKNPIQELERSLPRVWDVSDVSSATAAELDRLAESSTSQEEKIREVLVGLKDIIQKFESHVELGLLHPHGRHKHECSLLLEEVFRQLAQMTTAVSTKQDIISPFIESQRLLSRMTKEWKMDIQQQHCDWLIMSAVRAQEWSHAAELFRRQTDPNLQGYAPYDISISEPIGLYAVARAAQQNGSLVAEHVFDAVLQMTMVAPSNQDKYVLAAGTCLGLAGEWEGAVEYLKTSIKAQQLGQPLVAAVMKACLTSGKSELALNLYSDLVNDNRMADQWHWGGGQDRLDPVCRDLALRAMGDSGIEGYSDAALYTLDTVLEDKDALLTYQALYGVLSACEIDGRWADAVEVLFLALGGDLQQRLVRTDDELWSGSVVASSGGSLADVLAPVVRVCLSEGMPGIGVFCQIACAATHNQQLAESEIQTVAVEEVLVPLIMTASDKNELLAASLASLCGTKCFSVVRSMYNQTHLHTALSQEIFDGVAAQPTDRHVSTSQWTILMQNMHQVMSHCMSLRKMSTDDPAVVNTLSLQTGSCIHDAVRMSEPELAVIMGNWVERMFPEGDAPLRSNIFSEGKTSFPLTDSLLSSGIAAFSCLGNGEKVEKLVESTLRSGLSDNDRPWVLSVNEYLRVLSSEGKTREALSFFQDIRAWNRNPDSFSITAKGLADSGQWKDVSEMYRLGLTSGNNSDELSLAALRAIGAKQGSVRLLRNVVGEIAKHYGSAPMQWLLSRYWLLKDSLGHVQTRKLMDWGDADVAALRELDMVVTNFESRVAKGLRPEVVVLRSVVDHVLTGDLVNTRGLRIPQTNQDWADLLTRVSQEAETTDLALDRDFYSDVAVAFSRLGSHAECRACISDALARGIRLRQDSLQAMISPTEHLSAEMQLAFHSFSEPTEE